MFGHEADGRIGLQLAFVKMGSGLYANMDRCIAWITSRGTVRVLGTVCDTATTKETIQLRGCCTRVPVEFNIPNCTSLQVTSDILPCVPKSGARSPSLGHFGMLFFIIFFILKRGHHSL